MVNLNRPYHFKSLKDCLSQNLLGPFLNTLSHLLLFQVGIVFNFLIDFNFSLRLICMRFSILPLFSWFSSLSIYHALKIEDRSSHL